MGENARKSCASRRRIRTLSSRARALLSPDNNDTREYLRLAHLSPDFWISDPETISAKVISLADLGSRRILFPRISLAAPIRFDRPPRFTTLDDIKGLTFPLCACSLFSTPRQRRSTAAFPRAAASRRRRAASPSAASAFVFAVDCGFGKLKWHRSHATGYQRDSSSSPPLCSRARMELDG
jgi:hypothetical protein